MDKITIICVFTFKIEEIMIPSAQEQGEAISSAREQGDDIDRDGTV